MRKRGGRRMNIRRRPSDEIDDEEGIKERLKTLFFVVNGIDLVGNVS